MAAPPQHRWTREDYDRDAREYLAGLPLEHFMESTPQATQREVTTASFALLRARRADFRYFNELLVQLVGGDAVVRVVPDNMAVLGPLDDGPRGSYAVALESYPVFWTLEYVSESNRRKDYVDSFEKYESQLRVPYYLVFDPEHQDLRLYHLAGPRYAPVQAGAEGRYPIPELEVEVGLLDGWARYWHRGELLPLPAELQGQVGRMAEQLRQAEERLRRGEVEIARQQEDLRQAEEEKRQRDAEIRRQQEEIRRQQVALRSGEEETRQRDDEIARHLEELHRREAEITRQREREQATAALLRPVVESRARQAGRQDVLEALPGADGERLMRWLAELG
jgi:Uma2 family endonuclease